MMPCDVADLRQQLYPASKLAGMTRCDLEIEVGMLVELWVETMMDAHRLRSAVFLRTTPDVEASILETWQWLRGAPLVTAAIED
jgi:hypothetical protein